VRRFEEALSLQKTDRVVPMIIGEYKNDIARLGAGNLREWLELTLDLRGERCTERADNR
jgi:hypothetical protein